MGWSQLVSCLAVAKKAKQDSDTKIVLGGTYVSSEAEGIMEKFDFVDYAIKGPAWQTFAMLLEAIEKACGFDSVPGLVYRDGKPIRSNQTARHCINEMPPPDCQGLPLATYKRMVRSCYRVGVGFLILRYLLGTGCPFKCNFCRRNIGTTLQFKPPTKSSF